MHVCLCMCTCAYLCMTAYVCVYMHLHIHTHGEQKSISDVFLQRLPTYFLRQVSHWDMEATDSARLSGQWTMIYLSLPSQCLDYKYMLPYQTFNVGNGFKLRLSSSSLWGKHFTTWAIMPAPQSFLFYWHNTTHLQYYSISWNSCIEIEQ